MVIFQGFKKGFDEVIQRYVLSKNTPAKPSKKKAKGRIEKLDSHGKLTSIIWAIKNNNIDISIKIK